MIDRQVVLGELADSIYQAQDRYDWYERKAQAFWGEAMVEARPSRADELWTCYDEAMADRLRAGRELVMLTLSLASVMDPEFHAVLLETWSEFETVRNPTARNGLIEDITRACLEFVEEVGLGV